MLQKKKEDNRRHRKRTGIDVINDNDDAIARLIADMRQAARDDRNLNAKGNKKHGKAVTINRNSDIDRKREIERKGERKCKRQKITKHGKAVTVNRIYRKRKIEGEKEFKKEKDNVKGNRKTKHGKSCYGQ
jgi:hypothetical protein